MASSGPAHDVLVHYYDATPTEPPTPDLNSLMFDADGWSYLQWQER